MDKAEAKACLLDFIATCITCGYSSEDARILERFVNSRPNQSESESVCEFLDLGDAVADLMEILDIKLEHIINQIEGVAEQRCDVLSA